MNPPSGRKIDPETGEVFVRDVRPMLFKSVRFPGYQETVMLPGWYAGEHRSDNWPELEGSDWKVFNAAIARMRGEEK